ncbi:hypothetical protein B0H10DRAFT_2000333 [Mycena sp. CBHHK59/15]|nr:hypothetical protein B0H10DRAFT_2000333 [Mycena sp. CBHHK59/15]
MECGDSKPPTIEVKPAKSGDSQSRVSLARRENPGLILRRRSALENLDDILAVTGLPHIAARTGTDVLGEYSGEYEPVDARYWLGSKAVQHMRRSRLHQKASDHLASLPQHTAGEPRRVRTTRRRTQEENVLVGRDKISGSGGSNVDVDME